MGWVLGLLDAQLDFGFGHPILWREIIGNGFGLASALLALRGRVWAWPVGIIGNVLLFTVFLGGVFSTPQQLDLWGQAGRQVFFVLTSVYGWVSWMRTRRAGRGSSAQAEAVHPRWATTRERIGLVVVGLAAWAAASAVLGALDSWNPVADGWILAGSILATFGMARGWLEFWWIWVLVDLVGVPLLVLGGFYPSALLYAVYGGFCVAGFVGWHRWYRRERAAGVGVRLPR